ncbi:MAG: hypothetical protein LBI29_04515 [Rickettsiales bacterium]|jgi:hypothetical protein|nr:hypothetical protein [Rickettsiales bacterium]
MAVNIREFEKVVMDNMLMGESETFRALRVQYEAAMVSYDRFADNKIIIGFSIRDNLQPIKKDITQIINWDYTGKNEDSVEDDSRVQPFLILYEGLLKELEIYYHDTNVLGIDSNYSELYRKYTKNMKNRGRMLMRNSRPGSSDSEEELLDRDIYTTYPEEYILNDKGEITHQMFKEGEKLEH